MDMLSAALALAARGLRVFPLHPGGKRPAIKQFQIEATTDPATIHEWWSRPGWEKCNIGVSTTGKVVADVDTKKGKDGRQVYADNGGHYDTLVVQTATGGYHCYFDGPDSKQEINLLPGVDIRSHHGYVVGPGSVTIANGDDCVDGTYSIVVDKPVARVPLPIEIMLRPPGRTIREDNASVDTDVAIFNAAEWLKTANPAVEGMGGDDTTYKTCVTLVRDYALSDETAFSLLQAHWNHRCSPPWDSAELWSKVQNAKEYGQGALGSALPEKTFGGAVIIPTPPPPDPMEKYAASRKRVHMGNALNPELIVLRPWMAHKLLLAGDVTVLAGAGAVGKSAFQLAAFAHFALGRDFGPFTLAVPGKPLRTLVYNAEDDILEQSRRLYAVCLAYGLSYDDVRQNLALHDDAEGDIIVAEAKGLNSAVRNQAAIDYTIQLIGEERVDIAAFDPLLNLHNCNENDNAHMRTVIGIFRYIARATATASLLSHHMSKGARDDDETAGGIRGAANIVNSARNAVVLSRMSKRDAEAFNVKPEEAFKFMRVDGKKANMYQVTGEPHTWMKWNSVRLPHNADIVGVPVVADPRKRLDDMNDRIGMWIRDAMREDGTGAMNRAKAIRVIQQSDDTGGFYKNMSDSKLRAVIDMVFSVPRQVGEDTIILAMPDREGGERLLKLT